jgi:hypothetical protein
VTLDRHALAVLVALIAGGACHGHDAAPAGAGAPPARDAGAPDAGPPPDPLSLARIDVRTDADALDTPPIAAAMRAALYASRAFVGPDQPGSRARATVTITAAIRVDDQTQQPAAFVAVDARVTLPGDEPTLHAQIVSARPIGRAAPAAVEQALAVAIAGQVAADLVARAHQRLLPPAGLAPLLASADLQEVEWALELAGARRARALIPAITPLLNRGAPVGPAALTALVAIGDPAAVAAIAGAVDFNDPDALGAAIEAAVALGGPDATDFLTMIATGHHDRDLADRAQAGLARLARRAAPP